MTVYDDAWVAREEAKRAMMAEKGLYSPEEEHSSCGVGLVVNIDGSRSREVKLRTARKFLAERNKVKVTMQFRGREMAHINIGQNMMARIADELAEDGKLEADRLLQGRFITMVFAPKT